MRVFVLILILVVLLSACTQQIQERPQTKAYSHADLLFTTASTCAPCHDGLRSNGSDVSMYSNWRQSMLSLAAIDPYFLARMSSEITVFPELKGEIEEKCLVCHMPMATTQLKADGREISLEVIKSEYGGLALDGVSCTVCHQIRKDKLGREDSFSGGYVIDFALKKPDRIIYGPFVPLWANVMRESSGYTPVKGEHIRRAELCAVCHTLYTPTVSNGKIVGSFPEQTPFLEWKNSIYADSKTCQDCHMKAAKAKISTRPMKLEERDIRIHEFVGGNAPMLKLLERSDGAAKAEEQLKKAAKVEIVSIKRAEDAVEVKVKIENLAGHKFPTGFPSRRAFIHLTAYDENGELVFESGKYYADGRIEGEDKPYEKHHDVIKSGNEVQIYEAVMVDVDGNVTHVLLKAAGYIKDNRILPKGFDKFAAHPDTAVIGDAAEDVNFIGGSDLVTYILPSSVSKVRAELLYQPISYPAVSSLENTTESKSFLQKFGSVEKTILIDFDEKFVE